MKVNQGPGDTKFGHGVEVTLTGDEVATAIRAYLVAHNIAICGPSTVRVNGRLCETGRVFVDPSGFVVHNGAKISGDG